MQLTGGALKRLQALTPEGHEARIDLTISDEGPMALAFVVISAVPAEKPKKRTPAAPRRRGAPRR
jgi:holo-[acyl-carrier protein] synthase